MLKQTALLWQKVGVNHWLLKTRHLNNEWVQRRFIEDWSISFMPKATSAISMWLNVVYRSEVRLSAKSINLQVILIVIEWNSSIYSKFFFGFFDIYNFYWAIILQILRADLFCWKFSFNYMEGNLNFSRDSFFGVLICCLWNLSLL